MALLEGHKDVVVADEAPAEPEKRLPTVHNNGINYQQQRHYDETVLRRAVIDLAVYIFFLILVTIGKIAKQHKVCGMISQFSSQKCTEKFTSR